MKYLDETLNGLIIGLLIALVFVLASCNKDEIDTTSGTLTKLGGCVVKAKQITDWSYALTDGFVLTHTAGLEEMALSGNTGPLNDEFCDLGEFDQTIPSGLGDDVNDVGYAPKIVFGDYVVAMYHPIPTANDHFITYNWRDGSWRHWILGNRPTVFIKSN